MKQTVYFIAISLVLIISACSSGNDTLPAEENKFSSKLNTHNFYSEESSTVDWLLNDELLFEQQKYAFGNGREIEWKTSEEPFLLSTVDHELKQEIKEKVIQFDDTKTFRAFLVGNTSVSDILFIEHLAESPNSEGVLFRMIHAMPDVGNIDVYVGGTEQSDKLISNLDFSEISGSNDVKVSDISQSIIVTQTGVTPNPDTDIVNISESNSHDGGKAYIDVIAPDLNDVTKDKKRLYVIEEK